MGTRRTMLAMRVAAALLCLAALPSIAAPPAVTRAKATVMTVSAHSPVAAVPEPVTAPADEPEHAVIRSTLPVDGPLDHGEWHWDERAAPATGPVIVTVDLAAQTLSVFRDGHEIGVAVILYGTDEKPTPLGAFPVKLKKARHVSSIYGAPMPYTLRLTDDGVAIHGSDVQWNAATHGCIGVPIAFARKLFAAVGVGDVVIITDGAAMRPGDALPNT